MGNKKQYELPQIEIITLFVANVVTASTDIDVDDSDWLSLNPED